MPMGCFLVPLSVRFFLNVMPYERSPRDSYLDKHLVPFLLDPARGGQSLRDFMWYTAIFGFKCSSPRCASFLPTKLYFFFPPPSLLRVSVLMEFFAGTACLDVFHESFPQLPRRNDGPTMLGTPLPPPTRIVYLSQSLPPFFSSLR